MSDPVVEDVYDPFQDEEPLECNLENPEICESCQ
mgnify:FL=1